MTINLFGERTNIYLLINYGICIKNNRYDSVKLYLNLDVKNPTAPDQMLAQNLDQGWKIYEIRLKLDQFNFELLAYLRYTFKSKTQTRPSNLDFEHQCLEQYMKMVLLQTAHIEAKSSLEQDLEALKNVKEANMRYALIYTSTRKMILRS